MNIRIKLDTSDGSALKLYPLPKSKKAEDAEKKPGCFIQFIGGQIFSYNTALFEAGDLESVELVGSMFRDQIRADDVASAIYKNSGSTGAKKPGSDGSKSGS